MLYRFHVNVFAMPPGALAGERVELRGRTVATIRAAMTAFMPTTFEQAVEKLQKLPRLDAEPDGFFVVAGDEAGERWQVDGHLFDFGDRMHRVELHGSCPEETFDALLQCIGWPEARMAFSLVMEGVALEEAEFRAWASAPAPSH